MSAATKGAFPRRQSGISLIEVMVSVLILSIGLLGIAAMQATALRNGQSSLERSQAVVQSYSILDSIRADRDNVASYTTAKRCAATAAPTGATPEQTAANGQLNDWVASLKSSMGTAGDSTTCGTVNCAGNVCTVTVEWDDSRGKAMSTGSNADGSSARRTVAVSQI